MGRPWILLLAFAVFVAGALARSVTLAPPVRTATVAIDGGKTRDVTLPYSVVARGDARLVFTLHMRRSLLSPTAFVFVPDDHLESIVVNGARVSLGGVDPEKLDDYDDGFSFPLGKYTRSGDNDVEVLVLNRGAGAAGLDVRPDRSDWRNALELLLMGSAVLFFLGWSLERLAITRALNALLVFAVALRFLYLWSTPSTAREHDIDGHLEYIEYLRNNHALPPAQEGYLFYHPPLYFIVSAVAWTALAALGLGRDDILRSLQLQSMACELGFALFGIATAQLFLQEKPEAPAPRATGGLVLFSALLLTWPSSVLHAARIGNDDMTYLFFGAAMYFATRWWKGGRDRELTLAALAGGLGLLTKTSSILVFAMLGVLFPLRVVWRDKERRPLTLLRRALPAAAVFAVAVSLALGRAIAERLSGLRTNVLVGNTSRLTDDLVVGNDAGNYLRFDVGMFLSQPFTSPLDDDKGRQLFWNYLTKTALFGEWGNDDPTTRHLAVALSALFLAVLLHAAIGIVLRLRSEASDELPLFLLFAASLSSLLLLRMDIPRSCSGDFRYILPTLTPLCLWFVRGSASYRRRGWTATARGVDALGWTFAATSALFVLAVAYADR